MVIYEQIYKKLEEILGDFQYLPRYLKLKSAGYMDLNMDKLYCRKSEGETVIALSHYYKHPSGDLIPDPDMEIRIHHKMKMAEALTYQDTYGYQQAYPEPDKVNVKLKNKLNQFLNQWLTNLQRQGFKREKQQEMFG